MKLHVLFKPLPLEKLVAARKVESQTERHVAGYTEKEIIQKHPTTSS